MSADNEWVIFNDYSLDAAAECGYSYIFRRASTFNRPALFYRTKRHRMDWSLRFLHWLKRPEKRLKNSRRGRDGHHRGLHCEPLENRCLLSVTSNVLGTHALIEGPTAGSDSDIVESSGAWAASSNASWLHTTSTGNGNGLAKFTFDANTGATRTGTLTIAGVSG